MRAIIGLYSSYTNVHVQTHETQGVCVCVYVCMSLSSYCTLLSLLLLYNWYDSGAFFLSVFDLLPPKPVLCIWVCV